jgi:hypothetical protein
MTTVYIILTCISVCTSFTDTFTTYANTAVKGYNDIVAEYPITDASQCEDLCRSEPNCLSFEVVNKNGLKCYRGSIAYVNILDADPGSIVNVHSIYNRDCI